MADKPFPAYEDAGEYFFVSYSHDDTDLVYPEMAWLREAGFNLWYDDGIHVGTVWRRALADALSRSSGMVFFCTQKSIESDNCLKEINFALDDEKPVFVVQLDETPLPPELRLSLSDRQALRRTEFDGHTYRSRLTAALSAIVTPEVPETSAQQGERRAEMDPPSIAVLPISSISDDREVQLIAEALSEDMITHVSMVPWRTHAALASDAGRDPREASFLGGFETHQFRLQLAAPRLDALRFLVEPLQLGFRIDIAAPLLFPVQLLGAGESLAL